MPSKRFCKRIDKEKPPAAINIQVEGLFFFSSKKRLRHDFLCSMFSDADDRFSACPAGEFVRDTAFLHAEGGSTKR
jgi:hypothetical protein